MAANTIKSPLKAAFQEVALGVGMGLCVAFGMAVGMTTGAVIAGTVLTVDFMRRNRTSVSDAVVAALAFGGAGALVGTAAALAGVPVAYAAVAAGTVATMPTALGLLSLGTGHVFKYAMAAALTSVFCAAVHGNLSPRSAPEQQAAQQTLAVNHMARPTAEDADMTSLEKEQAAVLTRWAIDKATSVMKQSKEEILSTAWKEAPAPEKIERFEMIDQNIRHYLIKHFNPQAYTWMKATPEDTLFFIQCDAENSKPGAQISQDEVKTILHKHAGAAPRLVS